MSVLDLGNIDGPLLVFGGPYGNLEATEALLHEAKALGIDGKHAICTGDVVAYGADPQAVVDRLREWGCPIVMGNCEESLAGDAEDCGCGFDEGSACAALSAQWFSATRRDLDRDAKRWMGTLPRRITVTIAGRRLAAIHGGASLINRFLFASTPDDAVREEIAVTECDGVLAGHCGLPFTAIMDGQLWHNSGALGMPANDATTRVWYSVLTPARDRLHIEHHALEYDHAAAAAKMRARDYPLEYADALATGLWPSCDILPQAELAARGQAITASSHHWPIPCAAVAAE
jgi:hypothetical protein